VIIYFFLLQISCYSSTFAYQQFARTLISQGTLSPLHPIAQPIFWQYDAALSLYPLPDLIVIGDPSKGFQTTFRDCTVMNTVSDKVHNIVGE
jgi:hypothetical protein